MNYDYPTVHYSLHRQTYFCDLFYLSLTTLLRFLRMFSHIPSNTSSFLIYTSAHDPNEGTWVAIKLRILGGHFCIKFDTLLAFRNNHMLFLFRIMRGFCDFIEKWKVHLSSAWGRLWIFFWCLELNIFYMIFIGIILLFLLIYSISEF